MKPVMERAGIAIVQEVPGPDRFPGLADALRRRGIDAAWLLPEQTPYRVTATTGVVVVGELRSFAARYALRRAARAGACTVLLADGLDGVSTSDQAPAPVDVIACTNRAEAVRLTGLGNDAVTTPNADALADLLVELAQRPRRKRRSIDALDPTRLPARLAGSPGRPRVVSLVRCGDSPVGGVTTWSQRLACCFADRLDMGYDVRTLLVVTHADAEPSTDGDDDLTHRCVIDPMADQWQAIRTLRQAIENLDPAIVLPNYGDLCYAASMQLRPNGVPVIAIAHTDHAACRDVMEFYDRWDGAVGVSAACMEWLEPLAGDRPLAKIVYGVPVAAAPRNVADRGPLQLAYVGRMVQPQKRITDLLTVIDGLESRSVEYVFHVVGDGDGLAAWRRALDRRQLRHGRVTIHGRRSPQWVERFLGDIDASVLVSDYEGTSITMLESMGAGVVPAVTRVSSGVDEWIRNGDNGVVVPIGEPDEMAAQLAALAADRTRIARLGRAAWETVRGPIAIETMAGQYRELFDTVIQRPMDHTPTDVGVRLCDRHAWWKESVEQPEQATAWIDIVLGEAGYRNIALDEPNDGCDAVIVRGRHGEVVEERVRRYRAMGLGVAVSPHLLEAPTTERMHQLVLRAMDDGCRRVAIYGVGKHTRRSAGIFERGLSIIGLIDDEPPARRLFGLPVVTPDRAMMELEPDAVLLSSDAWEQQMWSRCAAMREAGVRVIAMYGRYGQNSLQRLDPHVAATVGGVTR
ncbi:MAG: glycosyltransferase family 4 protein [Phycisphaerales bacterium]